MAADRLYQIAIACTVALGSILVVLPPAAAQFPPEGAVSDPSNPQIATLTSSATVGDHTATVTVTYYYDCGKKKWVLTAASHSSNPKDWAPPAPIGSTAPSGPPPGSEQNISDPKRAYNPATGQNFALEKGNWIDVKTGKTIEAPKLCPQSEAGTAPAEKTEKSSHAPSRTQKAERPRRTPLRRAKRQVPEERTVGRPQAPVSISIGISGGQERRNEHERQERGGGFGLGR